MNADPEPHLFPAYQSVLFDWDGCLAHTLAAWMSSHLVTNARFGLEMTREEIVLRLGNPKGPFDFGLRTDQAEAYWTAMFDDVNVRLAEVSLFEGAAQLVQQLRDAGCKVAVITSSPRETLGRSIGRNGLADAFDAIIAAEDVTNHKPDPEALELALHRLGGNKEQAVMVGDSDKDLGAGRNAGVATMLMYPAENAEFHDLDFLMSFEPTHVCRSFAEATSVLLRSTPDSRAQ